MPSAVGPSYGGVHQKLRAMLSPSVEAGLAECWRCERLIQPGTPWQLGHDDDRPGQYRGPEHAHCGSSAGATKGNRARGFNTDPQPRRTRKW